MEIFETINNGNKIRLVNADCMDIMKEYPDKYFDLAVVDPPYGIKLNMNCGKRKKEIQKYKNKKWDIKPNKKYFDELFRISKNQIIWGGTCFILPISYGWICWDKIISGEVDFSHFELAWTSFNISCKIYRLKIQALKENRIHPTQKPIALYKWLLYNYAKPEYKILDTHLGSASSAIAAYYYGCKEFVGIEIDAEYYKASIQRFKKNTQQLEFDL